MVSFTISSTEILVSHRGNGISSAPVSHSFPVVLISVVDLGCGGTGDIVAVETIDRVV